MRKFSGRGRTELGLSADLLWRLRCNTKSVSVKKKKKKRGVGRDHAVSTCWGRSCKIFRSQKNNDCKWTEAQEIRIEKGVFYESSPKWLSVLTWWNKRGAGSFWGYTSRKGGRIGSAAGKKKEILTFFLAIICMK